MPSSDEKEDAERALLLSHSVKDLKVKRYTLRSSPFLVFELQDGTHVRVALSHYQGRLVEMQHLNKCTFLTSIPFLSRALWQGAVFSHL